MLALMIVVAVMCGLKAGASFQIVASGKPPAPVKSTNYISSFIIFSTITGFTIYAILNWI